MLPPPGCVGVQVKPRHHARDARQREGFPRYIAVGVVGGCGAARGHLARREALQAKVVRSAEDHVVFVVVKDRVPAQSGDAVAPRGPLDPLGGVHPPILLGHRGRGPEGQRGQACRPRGVNAVKLALCEVSFVEGRTLRPIAPSGGHSKTVPGPGRVGPPLPPAFGSAPPLLAHAASLQYMQQQILSRSQF